MGGLMYLLVVAALATRNGALLALAIPLAVYLGAGTLFAPPPLRLHVERALSVERARPGDPVIVILRVVNMGERLEEITIRDELPAGMRCVAGTWRLLTTLERGEAAELRYTVEAGRGLYRFSGVQVCVDESLGVAQRRERLTVGGNLFVLPPVRRMARVAIRPRGTRVYAGFIPARRGGPGVSFFGLRGYQPGDPLRWINWRVSARLREGLAVNQFEQERVADVGIILDTRLRSEVHAPDGASLFERAVDAAASLADRFLSDGNRVGLLMYGTQFDWTFPGYGKVQRERILQSLARARPGESKVFERLERLPQQLLPPNAQLVFVSPLQEDDYAVLVHLRARGYAVLALCLDAVAFELAGLDALDATTALAARLARVERDLLLNKLRQAGVQVADWDVSQPLDLALRAGEVRR